ncbi:hypothetical protein [Natranaerobius trueperi]|nr:hypothetical protein [Natranaerobius trueperi]
MADTMTHGEIKVNDNVAHGLGFSMYGGRIFVQGDAGGRLGQLN